MRTAFKKLLVGPLVIALVPFGNANAEDFADHASSLAPADITDLKQLSELTYSPDRRSFAFVASSSGEKRGGEKAIWSYELVSGDTRRLTSQDTPSSAPRWCPTGECLTYLSRRKDATQIFSLPMNGGEPDQLTSSETGVSDYEWSPAGGRIAFISDEPADPDEPDDSDELVTVVSNAAQQVWLLDIETGDASPLLDGRWRVSELAWLPDGKSIIVAASADVDSEIEYDRIYEVRLPTGEMTELWRPGHEFAQIDVSPDGSLLSFVAVRGDGPEVFDLFTFDLRSRQAKNLTGAAIDLKVQSHAWLDNTTLLATVEDGFQTRLIEVGTNGAAGSPVDLPVNPYYSLVVADSSVAFLGSSFEHPPELWISGDRGAYEQATRINASSSAAKATHIPQLISYESSDGEIIEAALYVPNAKKFRKPYPLVIAVHGGPSYRWSNRFNPSWSELLVDRGYAVLKPNIRGSTGYTYAFMMSNINDLGGADFDDVMNGADFLIDEGIADANRLGIAGWSYGGYMAAMAVSKTDRFKVAVSGAPVTNWITEYGTEISSINRYDRELLGAPYDHVDRYIKASPVFGVRNVSTPTLLICAENDVIDPIAQCWEYHRGLRQNKVETEYLIYKGVGHSRASWSNSQREDSMQRVLDWITTHL